MQNLVLFIGISLITGCVGAQFNDVAPVQSQIEEQFSKSQSELEVARRDFTEKTYVYKNLGAKSKVGSPNEQFDSMQTSMTTLNRINGEILKSRTQFTNSVKDKKQISSKDTTWANEQGAITGFNTNMAQFNRVLAEYSRESSTFGHTLSDNHVIVMAKVPDIRARMAENLEKFKKNLKVLDADLGAAKRLAKQNGKPIDKAQSETLDAERNAYADRLKELEDIFRGLIRDFGAKSKLSSTDAGWDDFQKLITESEIKSAALREIGDRLPVEIQSMRLSR